jgi:cyclic pyranopterin phosphate synthase
VSSFTHFNEQGRARMVDVSAKPDTERTALAYSQVQMPRYVLDQIKQGKVKKGDVLAVAQVAGVMAAKQTAQWIPMCHPLPLTAVDLTFELDEGEGQGTVKIYVQVKTTGKTGVEMEALTAAQAAALTIYDMCKALDKSMVIGPTYLLEKTGGKSGDYKRGER